MTKPSTPDKPAMRYESPSKFIRALALGAVVDMIDGPEDAPRLAFQLKSGGAAIHVVTPRGEVVGVFATPTAAAVHGFTRLDRLAKERHARPSDQPARDASVSEHRRTSERDRPGQVAPGDRISYPRLIKFKKSESRLCLVAEQDKVPVGSPERSRGRLARPRTALSPMARRRSTIFSASCAAPSNSTSRASVITHRVRRAPAGFGEAVHR